MESRNRRIIRFGTFEADPTASELRKGGRRVNLQEQPFRLLMFLLERPGEVVTRQELQGKLWGETYVDFEEGLNTAVRKLRDALSDSPGSPRFIETVPRRGYRFIAPLQVMEAGPDELASESILRPPKWRFWFAGCAAVLAGAGAFAWLRFREPAVWNLTPPIQLTRDSGLTTDPAISRDGKLFAYASDRAGAGNLDIWVQRTSGGEARRLTDDPADDREPDISPDGSQVAFRSDRDGGGIYSVGILGGHPRLILKSGYLPRFSPDGSRIAYTLGAFGSGGFSGKLHVFSLATGVTTILTPNLVAVGPAAWSPDGRLVVFAASKNQLLRPIDLWICSAEGGPATRISTGPLLEDDATPDVKPGAALFGQITTVSVAWFGKNLIVSAKRGDSSNLWASTISSESRQLTGALTRITLGSGNEALPSVSADGKLIFASHLHSIGIWEATPGKNATTASMRRLTEDRALNYRPSVSADGSKLAYVSNRSGTFEAWVRDLATGSEAVVAPAPKPQIAAAISRDGRNIAFSNGNAVYVAPVSGGAPRLLCEGCGRPDDWTPEGGLLTAPAIRSGIRMWNPVSGTLVRIAEHQTRHTTAPHLSPDGKWLTFHTAEELTNPEALIGLTRQVFIAPFTGQWIPPADWTAVTDGDALDREPRWSADGNHIYFLSDRDGFRCIWARKLEPKTKQPTGTIYPLLHLHNSRLSLFHVPNTGFVSVCPVAEKLIFAMGELNGNLWMTDLRQP